VVHACVQHGMNTSSATKIEADQGVGDASMFGAAWPARHPRSTERDRSRARAARSTR
jgi:hypothetical protein